MRSQFPVSGKAKIAVVAEAPSHEEIVGGRPLIGPSGRVLNQALTAAGIDRDDLYITNVFSDKADENDVKPWMSDPAIYEPEFARLSAEIESVSPNVIIPMGQTALWAFTGHEKITNFRGAVTKAERIRPGAKLLPTFHPAMILKQYKLLPLFVGDLIKATTEAEYPEIRYPKRTIHLEPTLADLRAFKQRCLEADPFLAVDIETSPKLGLITCIGFAPTEKEAMCVPFMDFRKPGKSYWPTAQAEMIAWGLVADILQSDVPKIMQNGLYDFMWLWKKGPNIVVKNYAHDTRLMHHVLFPELPKSLADMAANYTNLGAFKHFGGRYSDDKRDS